LLPNGTKLQINDALYSSNSRRNLLSFKDIRLNQYHIETTNEGNIEYLCITSVVSCQKQILERFFGLSSGLYQTTIRTIETNLVLNQKFNDPKTFILWHDRLGHPGSIMMRRIVENSHGHSLKNLKILLPSDNPCAACSQGKLITRPSTTKVNFESPSFLERIQGDICGPIHPSCGPFRYFMVLIDASTRWSHVCLLSTRTVAFARLLAQIIKLRAQFPDYQIRKIRLDNAGEFTSKAFDDYCMSIGIDIEHPVAHVHTQNGLAESLIKRLQLIARPLLLKSKLPVSSWGHAILHAASLIRIRPTSYHNFSPSQLVLGQQPNISHLRIFGCAVYVPISPPQRTKMGPQRKLGIYVGYDSPSIIRYLEPLTGDIFTARFADCQFDERVFPSLGGEKTDKRRELIWNASSLSHFDPRTNRCELEVQRIIQLQNIANQIPDAFTDSKKIVKSHIPAENVPARVDVPEGQLDKVNEIKPRLKRGRPIGAKDLTPRKRRIQMKLQNKSGSPEEAIIENKIAKINQSETDQITPEEVCVPPTKEIQNSPEEEQNDPVDLQNKEILISPNETHERISIDYVGSKKFLDRRNIIDDKFAFAVAFDIMNIQLQIPKYLFYQATKIFIRIKTIRTHVVQSS
jgi:transposase InsO family protein